MTRRQQDLFPELSDGKKYVSDIPELMAEWHPTKNDGLMPDDLTLGSGVKVWWECKNGHIWEAPVYNRSGSKGSGCSRCANRGMALTKEYKREKLGELSDVAVSRGGKLISPDFYGVNKLHEWECASGHRWKAKPSHVLGKTQSWCRTCNQTYSEKLIRIAFEAIFKHEFSNMRPNFLKNESGRNLELDGYCEKLKLAFEFDGSQHFKKTRFQNSIEMLDEIKRRDKIKDALVLAAGITLLRFNFKEDLRDIPSLIRSKIPDDRDDLLRFDYNICPDYKPAYLFDDPLAELRSLAMERGGKLISSVYINSDTKLEWECKEGHRWFQKPDHIKNSGTWCKRCSMKIAWSKRKAY